MKKGVIFLTILLIASLAGTYAVYELYVKERMRELAQKLEREKQLSDGITRLEDKFFRTEPPVLVQEWRQATQPWSDAVERRTGFFTFDRAIEPVKVPEEAIPRFYWREEIPKRVQALQDYADQKNVRVGDVQCGVPPPDFYKAGSNPTAAEIEADFAKYDYCASLTRLLVDAGPDSFGPLSIWPEVETPLRSGGKLVERTTGVNLQFRMQPFARFLDSLSQSDRYFRVEELRITNSDLMATDPLLNVDLVVTQLNFVPDVRRTTGGSNSAAGNEARAAVKSLFGDRAPAAGGAAEEDAGPSWFQRFRKNYLPF